MIIKHIFSVLPFFKKREIGIFNIELKKNHVTNFAHVFLILIFFSQFIKLKNTSKEKMQLLNMLRSFINKILIRIYIYVMYIFT